MLKTDFYKFIALFVALVPQTTAYSMFSPHNQSSNPNAWQNPEADPGRRITMLSWAAGRGKQDVVENLLNHGANSNIRDENGKTALSWAAENGRAGITRLLLKAGANPRMHDNNGKTALSWAAGNGRMTTALILLSFGADPNSQDIRGQTPLSWAAQKGCYKIVKMLLTKGANPNITSIDGKKPVDLADKNGHQNIVSLLKAHDVKSASHHEHERDYSPRSIIHTDNTTPPHPIPPLTHAMMQPTLNRPPIITSLESLIKSPIPLHAAAGMRCTEALENMLFAQTYNIDAQDISGATPLHHAAGNDCFETLFLLWAHKANLSVLDEVGETALDKAMKCGNKDIVDFLRKKRALSGDEVRQQQTRFWLKKNHPKSITESC